MTPEHLIIFLAIGYIFYALDKRQKQLPVPILLIVTGVILSFIPYFSEVIISRDLIYKGFLPALLFISAYRFSYQALKRYGILFGLLSTIGLLATALLLGLAVWSIGYLFLSLSFIGALLIASILTPTDPVSVESVLEDSNVNKEYTSILEGESMINDGTSVVIFTIVSNMYTSGESFSLLHLVKEFLFVSIGGVLIGFLFGWILSKNIYFLKHRTYQVMISIIIAYGSFYLAELIGVSGVLATVTSGIMFSYELQKSDDEDYYRHSQEGFWSIIEPTILSLVFIVLGIVSMQYIQWKHFGLFLFIFVVSIIVRFLAIAFISLIRKKWRRHLNWKGTFILTFAGVRGSMSIVLLLTLQAELSADHYILSLSFGAVLLSLILQTIIIYPLSLILKKPGSS
ncbi:cation:proton antiporter [Terribacillus saccharophilus]|uniref:cation:proton antiporter n=1 Tax=Terribacillus saccharophilus TaxID=361277 RepID=UPI0039829C63